MDHAHISNFRFRDWRLSFDLRRTADSVGVTVSSEGPGALTLGLPFGKTLRVEAKGSARFSVDPRQYYLAFGRSANAPERAEILSRVLLGREPPRDPASMTPAELEDFIVATETSYVPRNE